MSWSKSLLLAASLAVSASPAAAELLQYQLLNANFVRVLADGQFDLTLVPPLGLGAPITVQVLGSTQLNSTPSGSATADVGLPDDFHGGTQMGIYIESFDAHVDFTDTGTLITDLFDPLLPLLPAPLPIPLAGAVATIDIADLDVSMLAPLSSNLISIPDPNDYHWAGVTALRISGSLNLLVQIPGQEPIALGPPVPFDQTVDPAALAGSFTGDDTSTLLVVGSDDAVVNPDTAPLIAEPLVIPLDLLGSIVVTPKRLRLAINGNFTGVNHQYGLPPRTVPFPPGAGCGIGPELAALLPVLAWLRRRRQRA